jgi:hypothetical protein
MPEQQLTQLVDRPFTSYRQEHWRDAGGTLRVGSRNRFGVRDRSSAARLARFDAQLRDIHCFSHAGCV